MAEEFIAKYPTHKKVKELKKQIIGCKKGLKIYNYYLPVIAQTNKCGFYGLQKILPREDYNTSLAEDFLAKYPNQLD